MMIICKKKMRNDITWYYCQWCIEKCINSTKNSNITESWKTNIKCHLTDQMNHDQFQTAIFSLQFHPFAILCMLLIVLIALFSCTFRNTCQKFFLYVFSTKLFLYIFIFFGTYPIRHTNHLDFDKKLITLLINIQFKILHK